MAVPDWIAKLHSRYAGSSDAAASPADKGDLMARSSFKKSSKGGSLFGGKQAKPFGKKSTGKSAPAQKALRTSRPMGGPR